MNILFRSAGPYKQAACLLMGLSMALFTAVAQAQIISITNDNFSKLHPLGGTQNLACWAEGHLVGTILGGKAEPGAAFKTIKVKAKIRKLKLKLAALKRTIGRLNAGTPLRKRLLKKRARLRLAIKELRSARAFCSHWSPNDQYSGPEAIAVWAYTDGVSIPYRDDMNRVISGSMAHIGVAAYHATGIDRVEFNVQGTTLGQVVREETINPETNEYEYVFLLDPQTLVSDGQYHINATAYPKAGSSHQLPDLVVQKDTTAHAVWYLDPAGGSDTTGDGSIGNPFATLTKGFSSAVAGDLIIAGPGNYTWPVDKKFRYSKYVTLMPSPGEQPVVLLDGGEHINWEFVKIQGFQFVVQQPLQGALQAYEGHHLWFRDCSFEGPPNSHIYYNRGNARAIWTLGPVHHVVAERVSAKQFAAGLALVGAGHSIVRQGRAEQLNSTPVMVQTGEVLVSGNMMSDIGLNWRNRAWSVAKNTAALYDFAAGEELILMFSTDKGQTFAEVAHLTLSGGLSPQQVVDVLNADSGFAAKVTAAISEAPYPFNGDVFIIDKSSSEYDWFYVEGEAGTKLHFSDNTPSLNDLSLAHAAKSGTTHFDYISNTSGDFSNVVYRNNKGFKSATLGLKFGQISKTELIAKKNIAVINNILMTDSGHVMFSESAYEGQTTFDNFLIEHNLLWNTGGVVNAVTNFPSTINGLNWVIRNNIIGRMHAYDYSAEPYGWGSQDYNLQYQAPAAGAHTIVADPLFIGGLPSGQDQDPQHFRCGLNSPAVNSADPTSGIRYDIDWNLRDSRPDIGPYECSS